MEHRWNTSYFNDSGEVEMLQVSGSYDLAAQTWPIPHAEIWADDKNMVNI